MSKYNGWKNYETWNVALWIGNDEGLYNFVREHKRIEYKKLAIRIQEFTGYRATPDGVLWTDPILDIKSLDKMVSEL